jgi:hypothetical protein
MKCDLGKKWKQRAISSHCHSICLQELSNTTKKTSMKITDLVKDCTGDYKYEAESLKIYTTMFNS